MSGMAIYICKHTHMSWRTLFILLLLMFLCLLSYMFRVVTLQEQHYFINDSSACADKEATKAPTMQIRLKARLKPFSP